MNIIRKLSVGSNYKDAMHYIVKQKIFGDNIIHEIVKDNVLKEYVIWIKKGSEIMRWKGFNFNMPISIEYDINF